MTAVRFRSFLRLAAVLLAAGVAACGATSADTLAAVPPEPATDLPAGQGPQVAVLAGGCFWGMQAVFEHVRGVRRVWAGYSGGTAATAHYAQVGEGDTGHAESVKILYDPRQVSYGQLLKVFFAVAHDPTQRNRQGPDTGTQYRSAVFYDGEAQRRVAAAYIAQLDAAHAFGAPIATRLEPLHGFYVAEAYHQDYARLHPDQPYIVINDAPKVARLQRLLPALYQPQREVVDVQLH